MKWTYLSLVTFLLNCCSSKETKIITEIIYHVDTIYIEVNQPMDIFPWELGCADTANTQYAMNQCAAECFQVADSLTDQIYQLIRMDLIDQNTNRDRMENRFEQMERLDQLQANFTAIKILTTAFMRNKMGEGTMLPYLHLITKIGITEFEYQLLWSLKTNPLKG